MHQRSSPATIIGLTLLAGLVAGLLVACFHFFATEPTLQRAIDLETAHKMALGQLDPEVFTRPEQRAGLFLGYILYGIGWGSLFGIICWFAQARLSEASKVSWEWVFGLLFICYWTFCLFPQLKYPANPPGVGHDIQAHTSADRSRRLWIVCGNCLVHASSLSHFRSDINGSGYGLSLALWNRNCSLLALNGEYLLVLLAILFDKAREQTPGADA